MNTEIWLYGSVNQRDRRIHGEVEYQQRPDFIGVIFGKEINNMRELHIYG